MPTKSREVQMIFQNKGAERAAIELISELFERMRALEHNMNETNTMQIQVIQSLSSIVDGAGAMRERIEAMDKSKRRADDLDIGTAQDG